MRPDGVVAVLDGQSACSDCRDVFRLLRVQMHVRQRRGDSLDLDEHDKRGGGQPAKHEGIVVNRLRAGT